MKLKQNGKCKIRAQKAINSIYAKKEKYKSQTGLTRFKEKKNGNSSSRSNDEITERANAAVSADERGGITTGLTDTESNGEIT